MKRLRIVYQGRVQGVGFRATTRSIAKGLEVTGFVRNEPDGTVLLEVQGAQDQVQALLDGVRSRLGAGITGESQTDIPARDDDVAFQITH